jgi:hypothetical protein
VEKEFHLEIRSRRRENIGSCKWVSFDRIHRKRLIHTDFFV